MAHYELVEALWEGVLFEHIPGIFSCNPVCLHPSQANIDVNEHSVGPWWLTGGHGEVSPDTPHRGRTELQCNGLSVTSLYL